MLSSIHPLGERGRHNNWAITVSAFALGSTVTGALVGLGFGSLGLLAVSGLDGNLSLILISGVALIAGVLDVLRVRPPGPERQVNETWIGHYRGWVYGGGFGVQLGAGFMTYIVTWGVYAAFAAEFFSARPLVGAVIGGVFGFGRTISLLAARWIDRPSHLTRFHQQMARLGVGVHRATAIGTGAVGAVGGLSRLI